MLSKTFYFLLNMSIMGSIVGVIVLFIARVFSKYIPKKYIYAMWAIVAFRLLLPISISSKYSLVNILGQNLVKAIPIDLNGTVLEYSGSITASNSLLLVEKYSPIVYKNSSIESIFLVMSKIWVFGSLLCIITAAIMYLYTTRRLRTACYIKTNVIAQLPNFNSNIKVKETALISTPLLKGIIKPEIIVPKGMSDSDLKYALLHEICHIKRKDNLTRIIGILVACLHWFNPLVWLYLHCSEIDVEKACDEKVMKYLNREQIKQYASVLIRFTEKQRTPLLALGNTSVKQRIISIIEYKKIPKVMLVLTTLLLGVLAILLITNPIIR